MHCQVETTQAIVDRDATCILMVKGNQPTLFEALLDQFNEYLADDFRVEILRKHATVERSHCRNERREYYVIAIDPEDNLSERWPDARSSGMVYRCR